MQQQVKDFSDLQRVVDSLPDNYRQKFFEEVNIILSGFIKEQTEKINSSASSVESESKFSFKQPETKVPPPQLRENLDVLKASMNKNTNLPPPPPPPPLPSSGQLPPVSPLVSRGVGTGPLSFKGMLPPRQQGSKKQILSASDCMGFIQAILLDTANDALRNPSTPTDVYQFLKKVDGRTTLKQLHIMLYQNLSWGKYLEKLYLLFKERYFNFRKTPDFPSDSELNFRIGDILVSLGYINENGLEKALQFQKDGLNPTTSQNWMDKTRSAISQTEGAPFRKKLLGDAMVEMNLITKDQLSYALGIQRWFKTLIDNI